MDYLFRFIARLVRDSFVWPRDNIAVACVMAIAPPIAVYMHDPSHTIDWAVIWAAFWLYVIVFGCYMMVHGILTIWRLDREHMEKIAALTKLLSVQVVITGLHPHDPRFEISFRDARALGDNLTTILFTNRGEHEARNIRLHPIYLKKRRVEFPYIEAVLKTDHQSGFSPSVGRQWGDQDSRNMIRAFSEEWANYEDSDSRRDIFIPAKADFEDEYGVRFEVSFEFVYHAGFANYNPKNYTLVDCQNLSYRRIPTGITPPE